MLRARAYIRWLLVDPRFLWICLAGLGAALAVPAWLGVSERNIRLSGLSLQLAGIVTVVWGIISTRGFFGMPRIRDSLAAWWRRAPFKRQNVVLAAGTGSFTIFGEGHGFTSVPVDHAAPVDERIRVLERNVTMIHERITAIHTDARTKHDELKSVVAKTATRLEDVQTALANELRSFGTSGLHISAIGAAWLFLGSIMGSASQEIFNCLQ